MDLALLIILSNWAGALALSWGYCFAWWLAGAIEFEGWLYWRGWFPVARWRVVNKDSWFYRAWARFYGLSLLFNIIHRDDPGPMDDRFVEETIIHEMRHVTQQLAMGLLFLAPYGIGVMVQGYQDCWAEKDARREVMLWKKAGRPVRYRIRHA